MSERKLGIGILGAARSPGSEVLREAEKLGFVIKFSTMLLPAVPFVGIVAEIHTIHHAAVYRNRPSAGVSWS